MADTPRMALTELLRKAAADPDVDFLREAVRVLTQELMEPEVAAHLGADRHERTVERTGQRNGYRERWWDTRVGSIAFACRASGTGAISRRSWSRAHGRSGRWWP